MDNERVPATNTGELDQSTRYAGCLLGGAAGDALGAPVEFMSRQEILTRFGTRGITDYVPAYGGVGTVTDDTQMTLFTAEGLLRAWVRALTKGVVNVETMAGYAYLRWLETQGFSVDRSLQIDGEPGWLIGHQELHALRAPGTTCVSALREMSAPNQPARNYSKGCGAVMRAAPIGLFAASAGDSLSSPSGGDSAMPTQERIIENAVHYGQSLAALTHGHPTGQHSAGALAAIVAELVTGSSLHAAVESALRVLRKYPNHEETTDAIIEAVDLADSGTEPHVALTMLGEGWVAEEALAIALYFALTAHSFEHGVTLAVFHDGDSDSTGSIAGNLLGALHGVDAIPARWLERLELREVIREIATDLLDFPNWDHLFSAGPEDVLWRKYPGF